MVLFSESTLENTSFKNNIEAEAQLFHYTIDKKTAPDAYATALGGYLKYTTDSYYNIFASARFNSSNPVGANKNKMVTTMFNNDKNGTALHANSEAFIGYKTSSGVVKIGNMILNTPMMNEDTTRIVPWSYQGVNYTDNITKDIKIALYYINQIRSNTSSRYKKKSASGEIGDSGLSLLSVKYNGINGLHLQSHFYYAPELYSTFVGQLDYEFANKFDTLYCFGIQYFRSGAGGEYARTKSRLGGDDINLVALRAMIDAEDYKISLNYSRNYGDSGVIKGYGGLAKVYTTSMVANGRGNFKPETWMIKSSYNLPFNSHDSEIAFRLANTRVHDKNGNGFFAYYLHLKHFFNAHASIYLRYENINYNTNKSDTQYFRAIAKYKF